MEDVRIVRGKQKDLELFSTLATNIRAFNQSVLGTLDVQTVSVCAKDSAENLVGGLYAEFVNRWLLVHAMWVAEERRGQGLGRRLMEELEQFAAENQAIGAQVDTTSFQAPGFYEKFGYREFGRLENFYAGHSRIYLAKRYS